ncbi:hypothetical protein [Cupriavidus basilensis]|uniref:hypothetical protein n=1 Tax=Cupriavidus basilensis TaxID=68895 RepID=UPI000302336D|nr:hypothetical protein [Cupriavidus basilensis]
MNALMASMIVAGKLLMRWVCGSTDPMRPGFWFVMPMALVRQTNPRARSFASAAE